MRLVNLDKFPLLPNELEGHLTEYERGYLDAQSNLNALPNVDAEPVRHGHWINKRSSVYCSRCGKGYRNGVGTISALNHNYCPNCGARMSADDNT